MFKVGDHVSIISKKGGAIGLQELKRRGDCPNLSDCIIKAINDFGFVIGNYYFNEQDLKLVNRLSPLITNLLKLRDK